MGYVWGQPVDPLRALIPDTADPDARPHRFYALVLSRILSSIILRCGPHLSSCPVPSRGATKPDYGNPRISLSPCKKHRVLLTTCELAIAPGGCVLVFYTHHRPHLAQRDMAFFDMARECGWMCEKVLTERFPVRFSWLFGSLVSSCHLNVSSLSLFSPCFRRTRVRRRCARPCTGGSSHERETLDVYF